LSQRRQRVGKAQVESAARVFVAARSCGESENIRDSFAACCRSHVSEAAVGAAKFGKSGQLGSFGRSAPLSVFLHENDL
jgi:hypothetical protein